MKEEKTTPLRQRMIEDMDLRGLCEKTQKAHIRNVKHFASFLGRPPDTATPEDLRAYRTCLGVIRLANKFGAARLDTACAPPGYATWVPVRRMSITGLRAEKRFMRAIRMWISAVWRSGSLVVMRSPKAFRQRICASVRLRAWYPVQRFQKARP
jgi:hypothetical protein